MGKTIIFELGGVLVNLDWDKVCAGLQRHSNSGDVRSEVVNGPIVRSAMQGLLSPEAYQETLCRKLHSNLGYEEFVGIWNGLLSANYDIIPLVERLKPNHRLILASNTDPIHFAYTIQNCSVLENFESFFLSYEMRLLKPDPEFYRHVLKTLAVPAGECVFIDDRVENVESARSVGITSFRFVSVDRLERDLETIL
jgi:HAD superfamily hydrolase (TIGR01509 family)